MKFVDRKRELRTLNDFYNNPNAGLLVLYGRRRIGKTSLLSNWIEGRFAGAKAAQAIYWTATTQSADFQLGDFSRTLAAADPRRSESPSPTFTLLSWEEAFRYTAELAELRAKDGSLVIVIDEFTYLVQSDPGIVSILQRTWDHTLSKSKHLRLILSGSLIGVMEKDVLSAQAPLYGRARAVRLRPLEFGALVELFPHWKPDARVAIYAVCGGIPAYLDLFERAGKFDRGLLDYGLAPNSIMLTDAALLLNERLDEPHVYESVIATIASGFHEWSEIGKIARVNDSSLGHYLQTLQSLEMIERMEPVLSERHGRRGRYYVSDPFLRFYYRFIVPNRTAIQRGLLGRTVQTITDDLRGFIGTYVFESLCRDWVLIRAEQNQFDWLPEEYGAYWRHTKKSSVQLDVVAASQRAKRLIIGEAKWTNDPIPRHILTDLIERSQRMPQVAEGWKVDYILFSRAGFTDATKVAAKELNAQLVDLAEIEQAHIDLVAAQK